jgi:hypothetical protein
VGGQAPYPLRQCQFEFTQATGPRGRAAAKVRHGLLHLTLDVPTDDQLLDWSNTVLSPSQITSPSSRTTAKWPAKR